VALGGTRRQPALPDVPTLAELGLAGFEDLPYYGFFAPAGTPPAALEPFSRALAKVVGMPDVRDRLAALGLTVDYMSAQQLAERERRYATSWAGIIKRSGFQPQ
jgi:tripartite-type tricarboxylate transporter receptor subunit TctC